MDIYKKICDECGAEIKTDETSHHFNLTEFIPINLDDKNEFIYEEFGANNKEEHFCKLECLIANVVKREKPQTI